MILAHNKHVSEMIDLSDEERNQFYADIAKVARAIHKVYKPNKINYGAYGDTGCHLHMHLVPKYEGQFEWGGTFEMNPGKVIASDAECEEIAEKIRQAL
jgi:diadenosine tetraphosphate (Ap4A) HIT family hydrolase